MSKYVVSEVSVNVNCKLTTNEYYVSDAFNIYSIVDELTKNKPTANITVLSKKPLGTLTIDTSIKITDNTSNKIYFITETSI